MEQESLGGIIHNLEKKFAHDLNITDTVKFFNGKSCSIEGINNLIGNITLSIQKEMKTIIKSAVDSIINNFTTNFYNAKSNATKCVDTDTTNDIPRFFDEIFAQDVNVTNTTTSAFM